MKLASPSLTIDALLIIHRWTKIHGCFIDPRFGTATNEDNRLLAQIRKHKNHMIGNFTKSNNICVRYESQMQT